MTVEILRKVQSEIQRCFERWDDAIENNQQPVAIQDLDYWNNQLKSILGEKDLSFRMGRCYCMPDDEPEVKLFQVGGQWVCGDCANEYEHDKKFYTEEYPND